MPKKSMIEYECERCRRKWYSEDDEMTPSMTGVMCTPDSGTVDIGFSVLCRSCSKTVHKLVQSILKIKQPKDDEQESEAKEEEGLSATTSSYSSSVFGAAGRVGNT